MLTALQMDRNSVPKTAFCRATTRYLFNRLSHDSPINCFCDSTPCHDVILRSNYNTKTHTHDLLSRPATQLIKNHHVLLISAFSGVKPPHLTKFSSPTHPWSSGFPGVRLATYGEWHLPLAAHPLELTLHKYFNNNGLSRPTFEHHLKTFL